MVPFQGPAGFKLHRDLLSCQWLRGDRTAAWAGMCQDSLPWANETVAAGPMTLSPFFRTTASTRAMWKGTRAQRPALAPVLASGMYCRSKQEVPFYRRVN